MDELSVSPQTRNLSNRHPNSLQRDQCRSIHLLGASYIYLSYSGQLWTTLRNLSDSHTTRVTGAFSLSKLSNPQTQYPKRCSPVETYRTGNESIACTHVPLNEVAPWLRDLDIHVADSAIGTG